MRYIVYSYWLKLSGGSLRAGDGATSVRAGKEIFGVSNEQYWRLTEAIAQREPLSPLIILGTGEDDLVVLEGHVRLTSYILAGDQAPARVEVILGLSPHMPLWKMYSKESYDRLR